MTDYVTLNASRLSTLVNDKGHLGIVTQALLANRLRGRGGATVLCVLCIGLRQHSLIEDAKLDMHVPSNGFDMAPSADGLSRLLN